MDATMLFLGIFIGSIGVGYFIYGKKQRKVMPTLSGIGLIILPYVLSNPVILTISCLILAAAPFLVNIDY
jgi:hypothetical protein